MPKHRGFSMERVVELTPANEAWLQTIGTSRDAGESGGVQSRITQPLFKARFPFELAFYKVLSKILLASKQQREQNPGYCTC